MRRRVTRAMPALAAIVFFTSAPALAEVPTAKDMAHCNEKAKDETQTASASPRLDSEADAKSLGKPRVNEVRSGTPSARHDDPQLQGIDLEGAKDPAYVAAYKTCMRQSGF
jgi:hypothetical protein